MIMKVFCKNLVSFGLIQNVEILNVVMAKDEKVNIAVIKKAPLKRVFYKNLVKDLLTQLGPI
jgi:hypothetical protein